ASVEPILACGRYSDGGLAVALPLARQGRTLRALRTTHTVRVDLVGDPTALPQLWDAILREACWDCFELRGVPVDSPLATSLPDLARRDGLSVYTREIARMPWFEIAGIEQRIHRRFRGDMRRLERQLGGIELESIRRFDRTALRDFYRLEVSGWKGDAGTAIALDRRLVAYYGAIARVFAPRGQLSLAFVRARGERIAGCIALEDETCFYLLKIAHDPRYAHYGPGQLLVRETALDAGRRGLRLYDLLGRDSAYKMKWTDRVRPHVEVRIYASSLRARTRRCIREIARPMVGRVLRGFRRPPPEEN
ncbi:MAG TPA: GNAT family N-acetyltransferase, partial [Polyangiaceae bacterium]|nr:GNAT family N-acetyltransferase [Polyangiaceae bacterium]